MIKSNITQLLGNPVAVQGGAEQGADSWWLPGAYFSPGKLGHAPCHSESQFRFLKNNNN